MNVRTMRRLDRLLGVPLCWLLGMRFALARKKPSPSFGRPRCILVMKCFGIGSVLLTFPFLDALRQQYPSARLLYLSFESNREILERAPHTCEILTVRTSSLFAFVSDTWSLLLRLRKARVDVVFDLEFFSKYSTLVSALSGASLRAGYALPAFWRRANLTHPVSLDKTAHVVSVFLRQLEVLSIEPPSSPSAPELAATPAESASMEQKLGLQSNGCEPMVINMNAGPTSLERRWPTEHFLEVAARLLEKKPSLRFFFTGTADERAYVEQALARNEIVRSRAVNCAGLLSLGEFIALLSRSRLLLTNDSAPMHIAAAVGTPVVALFGPESPQFYGPLGQAVVLYKPPACSPCLNIYNAKLFTCPYQARCMKQITSEDVLQAIERVHVAAEPVAE